MTGKSLSSTAGQRKPKVRRFHIVSFDFKHRRSNWEVENLYVLSPDNGTPGHRGVLLPPKGRRGFPVYPEEPRLVIGKRKVGHPPRDMEMFHSYWLISDPLKILFESIDPDAFAFQRCDVKLGDGSTGPVHWLCDVVRVLDDRALDESTLQKMRNFPWRLLSSIATFDTVVLNGDVVGDAHIFRAPYPSVCVVCDQDLKDACKQARIKGIQFGGKLLIQ